MPFVVPGRWTVLASEALSTWFSALRHRRAARLIQARIDRTGAKATQGKGIASALALAKQRQEAVMASKGKTRLEFKK